MDTQDYDDDEEWTRARKQQARVHAWDHIEWKCATLAPEATSIFGGDFYGEKYRNKTQGKCISPIGNHYSVFYTIIGKKVVVTRDATPSHYRILTQTLAGHMLREVTSAINKDKQLILSRELWRLKL